MALESTVLRGQPGRDQRDGLGLEAARRPGSLRDVDQVGEEDGRLYGVVVACRRDDGRWLMIAYLRIVGSEGSMDVKWREVVLKRNITDSGDAFAKAKAAENTAFADRKKMLPPKEIVYKAEDDYKGAHYDHFANFFNAIRTGGSVVEDPVFGFRAAAPALLCNDSYHTNRFINWDPISMKVIS